MKTVIGAACFLLLLSPCCSRSVVEAEEQSVVSIYTTLPTGTGTGRPFDVYQQIAANLAQRITSPIYRFFGFGANKTEESTSNKPKSLNRIEILDDNPEDVTKSAIDRIGNNINNRDVEELSTEALKRVEKKPEKVTLYSSYLPAKLEQNDTVNEVEGNSDDFNDEPFEFDDITSDFEAQKPRVEGIENAFITVLEFFGNWFQLIWGGLSAYFSPAPATQSR